MTSGGKRPGSGRKKKFCRLTNERVPVPLVPFIRKFVKYFWKNPEHFITEKEIEFLKTQKENKRIIF